MSGPGVQTNTKYRCVGCGSIHDFQDSYALLLAMPCPNCGEVEWEQIRIVKCCDFCGENDARWKYPANDFPMPTPTPVAHMSRGPWAACDICSGMIEVGNIKALANRSAERTVAREPGMARYAKQIARSNLSLHQRFLNHRCGERELDEGGGEHDGG